jgi:SAM-dependent methyltransferase
LTELYGEHADLYDLAFDWDVTEEVDWLLERLGPACRSVLEPGCGSGRIVEAIARRGLDVVGLDRSPAMVEIARRRGGPSARILLADMTDFDVERVFDGAVCPINTLAHLSPNDLSRHLERIALHLRPGARYLVQLELHDPAGAGEGSPSEWEAARGELRVRVTWSTEDVDLEHARQRQRSRVEILSGARAGEVVEELHSITAWTPQTWSAAVEASPFSATAVFGGEQDGRPWAEPGAAGRLLWHELTRDDD